MTKIVSVQDISCYGQCSLTVALPILSAYGIETAILPSSILSTHTGGFKDFVVHDLTELMPSIVEHWKKERITFDAVYTGYIGDSRQFDCIKSLRTMLNPGGKMIVDPAMADHGRLYGALNEDIVEGMRGLVREADIILPNLTEGAFLLKEPYKESYSKEEIEDMLKRLAQMGPETVILTGVDYEEGKIGAACYTKSNGTIETYFAEKQAKSYHGTGDAFSSVLVASLLNGKTMQETLQEACEFVVDCIRETVDDPAHFYSVKFEKVLAKRR